MVNGSMGCKLLGYYIVGSRAGLPPNGEIQGNLDG